MLAEDKRGRSKNNFLLSRENALATLMSSIIEGVHGIRP